MDFALTISNQTSNTVTLQSDPYTFWLVIGTFAIAVFTLLGILLSNRRTKESIDLTRKEMEARLKPILQVLNPTLSNMTDKSPQYTKFKCDVKNIGKSPASDYSSYYFDYLEKPTIKELIRDEVKIKKQKRLSEGLIPPNYFDYIESDFTWQIDSVNKSWIVLWFEYRFLDKLAFDEIAYVIYFEKSQYRGEDIYDKTTLETGRKQFQKK